MNTRTAASAAIATTTLLLVGCERPPTMDTDTIGQITLFKPEERPNGLVFLLSDKQGWSSGLTRLAKHLRKQGVIVAGVDSRKLLARLRPGTEQCLSLVQPFESVSQRIQSELRLELYHLPVLSGIGEGATLALAGLWQAGPETFAGAMTVNFRAALATPQPLCAPSPAQPAGSGRGYVYAPPDRLFGWWQAAWTEAIDPDTKPFVASERAGSATLEPGLSSPRLLERMFDRSSEEQARDTSEALKLGALAVVELPGRPGTDTAAIIFSGDGGWRDLDRRLGELLATSGLHVVGIDCLRYFWNRKPPETAAADLDRLILELGNRSGIRKIALIGYSFGADVLPAVYNRLSPEARERVVLLSLLALGRDAHFEIHISGWLGGDATEDAMPIAPELARIEAARVQCIYGEEEAADSGCREAVAPPGEIIGIPGGHHFDEDYPALAERILRRLNAGISRN